jgi:hypothetical protein
MGNNMACNGPPNPTTPSDKIISVTAGTNVSAVWRHTLQCEQTFFNASFSNWSDLTWTAGPNDVMDPGHKVRI